MNQKIIGHSGHFIDHRDGTVTDTRSGLRLNCQGLQPALAEQVFPAQLGRYFWPTFRKKNRLKSVHEKHSTIPLSHSLLDGSSTKRQLEPCNSERPSLELSVTTSRDGLRTADRTPKEIVCANGDVVTLIAMPHADSKSARWVKGANGAYLASEGRIDSVKTVSAEFAEHEKFTLNATKSGAGSGQTERSLDAEKYIFGTERTSVLSAHYGGRFSGWRGDTTGWDDNRTMRWSNPPVTMNFTFRCKNAGKGEFELIKAISVEKEAPADNAENVTALASILQRLEVLEGGWAQVLRQLDALQSGHHPPLGGVPSTTSPQSLPDVLLWLSTQDRTSIADLRIKLLPLGLLPSAVMDDINERALNLTGEAALEDDGTTVLVQPEVLLQVITQWQE
jgi:hypothetical protein